MATRSSVNDIRVIDSDFYLPPGLTEFRRKNPNPEADSPDSVDLELTLEVDDTSGTTDDTPFTLQPPTEFIITDQVVRSSTSGQQVIDVTIEFTDAPGALDYEVRITKL